MASPRFCDNSALGPWLRHLTVFQVVDHVLQELPERRLRDEEVVDGEHARDGVILARLLPGLLAQVRRRHKVRLQRPRPCKQS